MRSYRGKDKPTNVLSFPAAELPRRSPMRAARRSRDLPARAARARRASRARRLRAHWAHLVVHGALHLLGYDHEHDAERRPHGAP